MDKTFIVYILSSAPFGYLYIGVTSDILKRLWEHENDYFPQAYTKRRKIKTLIYYEAFESPDAAFAREKQIKRYSRQIKFEMIGRINPNWQDLSAHFKT
jgi:putative endonuclease